MKHYFQIRWLGSILLSLRLGSKAPLLLNQALLSAHTCSVSAVQFVCSRFGLHTNWVAHSLLQSALSVVCCSHVAFCHCLSGCHFVIVWAIPSGPAGCPSVWAVCCLAVCLLGLGWVWVCPTNHMSTRSAWVGLSFGLAGLCLSVIGWLLRLLFMSTVCPVCCWVQCCLSAWVAHLLPGLSAPSAWVASCLGCLPLLAGSACWAVWLLANLSVCLFNLSVHASI